MKERCFDVFSEPNKRTKYGEKVITMNYTKYLMNQTLSVTSKLKIGMGRALDAYERQ